MNFAWNKILEIVTRFTPTILFFILIFVMSKYEPTFINGLVAFGIPLFIVGIWVIIKFIDIKQN